MIEVQHVDGRMYFVWLDERLLTAIGWGAPEKIIEAALTAKLGSMFPDLFRPATEEVSS